MILALAGLVLGIIGFFLPPTNGFSIVALYLVAAGVLLELLIMEPARREVARREAAAQRAAAARRELATARRTPRA